MIYFKLFTSVLKMIYQVGKKQCSNSGRKRNDVDPLKSSFVVQPPSPLEFSGPLTPSLAYFLFNVEFSGALLV